MPLRPDAVRLTRALNAIPILDLKSLIRFGIIGVAQNAFFYLVALALIARGWQAWEALLVLNPIAVVLTFLANKTWSFGERKQAGGSAGQLTRYVALYGATYLCSVALTWTLERIGVPSWLAMLVTIVSAACALYLALNLWVFRREAVAVPSSVSPPHRG